jgi:hypothetical protein
MNDPVIALKTQLDRQITHWTAAATRLQNLDDLASPVAQPGELPGSIH